MSQRDDVFISYSRTDREFAQLLRQRLINAGLKVWRDREEMRGGRNWWEQIVEALQNVRYMVLCASPESMSSEIVTREWRQARQEGVCIVPVMVAGNKPDLDKLPSWMRETHFYDMEEDNWETLLGQLKAPCDVPRVPFMAHEKMPYLVERPAEYNIMKAHLCNTDETRPLAATTAFRGGGGFGKTILATMLCHDENVIEHFTGGILGRAS